MPDCSWRVREISVCCLFCFSVRSNPVTGISTWGRPTTGVPTVDVGPRILGACKTGVGVPNGVPIGWVVGVAPEGGLVGGFVTRGTFVPRVGRLVDLFVGLGVRDGPAGGLVLVLLGPLVAVRVMVGVRVGVRVLVDVPVPAGKTVPLGETVSVGAGVSLGVIVSVGVTVCVTVALGKGVDVSITSGIQ
jgi:hypothetical protein